MSETGPQGHGFSEHENNALPPNPGYQVKEQPLGSTKHVRIVGIGAGASGLNMIRTLRLKLQNYEFVIYEKNEDVGGTWLENSYPGCRCDIPSHNYQFSWRSKHDWSNFFAPAEEIRDYLRKICDDEGMRDSIKLQHKIVSARWEEAEGVYKLRVQNLQTGEEFDDYANILLDGSGILNNWKWPDVPDREAFTGTLIHTARWPKGFDHTGKNIVLIGNGATGVQLLPEIQKGAKRLHHIVRTPTWVVPPRLVSWKIMKRAVEVMSKIELDQNENFTPETKEKFESDPVFYRSFVKDTEKEVNNLFPIIMKDSQIQAFARDTVVKYMTGMLKGDEKLCKALIPTYPLGCRRMTPGHGYLEALTKDNVEVVTDQIRRFVADGIELESGEVIQADVIVCATGFESSFCPRFPLIGRQGDLRETWSKEPAKAYMSCAVAGLPNYFTFLGPNAPIGHGSVFTLTEHIAKYIADVIKKCQTEGIRAIAPSQAAVDDYFEHISAFMPRTAWSGSCKSWFKGGHEDGPVTALHPGSRIHFFHMLEHFRGEDFEYVYDEPTQNRFHYLGNGFSTKELDPNGDPTWYLDNEAL